MSFTSRLLFVWCLLSCGAFVAGQEAPVTKKKTKAEKSKAEEPSAEKNLNFLPSPLQAIRTNVLALEAKGYFTIDDVRFGTRGTDEEAVSWTVRVEKPVTCRHIEAMLRDFRDVRFYETVKGRRIEIFADLLHYSQRIRLGASNDQLIGQDDVFELWIDLTAVELRKLKSQRADSLVLRRWKY